MSRYFKTAAWLVCWLVLGSGLYYFFEAKLNPNTIEKEGAGQEVNLKRDPNGHYRAEALIDGVKTTVLVDTGADDVSISQEFANKLGIKSQSAIRTQTANGDTVGYFTRLDSVKLGGIEVTNVAALIVPNLGADALLGMSFLNRMDVRLHHGTMTIRADN
jgi:aspartyl protease family protein